VKEDVVKSSRDFLDFFDTKDCFEGDDVKEAMECKAFAPDSFVLMPSTEEEAV
jgi:hypothetical protein